jgi:hypothetical protein
MSQHLIKANALFLHIPKTGGSWVESVMQRLGIDAVNPKTLRTASWRHCLRHQFLESFRSSFAFVRHPVSWYESWWKFQAQTWVRWEPGVWHPQRGLERCASDDFNEFIHLCIEHEPAYVSRMYEWYIGPPGVQYVNRVGRHESLADDLVEILRSLGYEPDEAVLRIHAPANVSAKKCGDPIWDPQLKRRILELEAPALKRFYAA